MKKLTFEEAKKRCEESNVKILCSKEEWKGVVKKENNKINFLSYWFQDKKGHNFYRTYNSVVNSKHINCDECAREKTIKSRAIKYEDALINVKKLGCGLLCSKNKWNKHKTHGFYKFKCKCGNIFFRNYDGVVYMNHIYCEECAQNTPVSYENAVNNVMKLGCTLLCDKEEWEGVKKKYYFLDIKGHKFYRTYDNVVNGKCVNCKECSIKKSSDSKRISEEEFQYWISKIYKNNNLIVDTKFKDFKGIDSQIDVCCPNCGYKDKVLFESLKYKNRSCQNCNINNISSGEAKCMAILKTYGIPFIHQAKFDELKYKEDLRVDFYVPIKNNSFKGYVIEIQSSLHDDYNDFIHRSVSNYEEYIRRDEIKRNYFLERQKEYKLIYANQDDKKYDKKLNMIVQHLLNDKRIVLNKPQTTKWTDLKRIISLGKGVAIYEASTGNFIKFYKNGVLEITTTLEGFNSGSIYKVLSGKDRHNKGYIFKYANSEEECLEYIQPIKNVLTHKE